MTQIITSNKTSLNQVPALHKWFANRHQGPLNVLDYGCGKYDQGMDYLRDMGYDVMGYDPYNRPDWYNAITMNGREIYDICLCANVLNVIDSDEVIKKIAKEMRNKADIVYISVYDGDKTGNARETTKGYQRNARIGEYVNILKEVFPFISRHGTVLECC